MKTRLVLLTALFALTAALSASAAAVCQPPPAGLVGWWPGDGNANDITGLANGTLQGGATATTAGEVGQAFSFNGTSGYVSIPDSPVLHPANLTIEAWVRFSSLNSVASGGSPAGDQYLVFKQNTRSGDFEGIDLSKTRLAGKDVFRFLVTSASAQVAEIDSATSLTTNVWYHVAAVRGSNFTQLYVNGRLERQMTVSFPQDYGTLPLYFGTSGQTYWDHKLSGSLDEVSLYNRALASNEIAAIYAAGAAGKCKGASGPSITVQPLSQTVAAGANVNFSVTASGTAPLSYQWRWNGAAILGATNQSFLLANAQPANAGNYSVVVTNSAAMVTSTVAVLTVLTPPLITTQPQSVTKQGGQVASFSATATGSAPLNYQWQQNGVNLVNSGRISGATTNALQISNLQSADAGNYALVVSNGAGTVTSAVAVLTVTGPPVILTQPVSQSVTAGATVNFSVTASGTAPFTYQWQKAGVNLANGGNVSGVTGPMLTLAPVGTNDAGSYLVKVSNSVGSSNSAVANLTVSVSAPSGPVKASAIVLVNSHSANYLDFQHFVQPYLLNFGVPYTVQDIAINPPDSTLTNYALIIIGHSQFDINHTYLNSAAQAAISTAVFNGTGLVSFDNVLSANNAPLYDFEQSIFGLGYSSPVTGPSVVFPPTESGAQMHYITSLHLANETLVLSNANNATTLTVAGLTLPANETAVAKCGGAPLLAIAKYGQGRAVQWASYDWMSTATQGPVNGLDDLVWRGFVWSARKPFVMRGMPNLATMRIDDVTGNEATSGTQPTAFWWVHQMTNAGFKPWLSLFTDDVSYESKYYPADGRISDLSNMVASGSVTASMHSFSANQSSEPNFFYFDHKNLTPYSDSVMANNYTLGTQFFQSSGIPSSKVVIAHYSEMGLNSFNGLTNWGVQFVMLEMVPGTLAYEPPYAPWMKAGPYRLYDTPQQGQSVLPFFYADWLTVPNHPELDGKFFDCYTAILNVGPAAEWAPAQNDVPGSITRGYQMLKRGFDSMVMGNIFTHEFYIDQSDGPQYPTISTNNFMTILRGITNAIAPYNPMYVTLDYACQYVRATRTSTLVAAAFDPATGLISATLTGKTDLPINIYVYTGADSSITSTPGQVPIFNGSTTITLGSQSSPALAVPLADSRLEPVSQAPQLLTPFTQDGNVILSVIGESGCVCRVEGSPDLLKWVEVKTVTLLNGTATVSDPITAGHHFYRATLLQ